MKLPKPRKRGSAYRIEIMIDGKRYSCTRDTAKECKQWASQKILEHTANNKLEEAKETITLLELMTIYHEKIGKNKPSADYERVIFKAFKRDFEWIGVMQVHEITPKHLTKWKNDRLLHVENGTVRREISYLSAVFSYAVKELFIITENPFTQVQKPSMPNARYRRITDDEISIVLESATYSEGMAPVQSQHYFAWCFLFAINTAMRRGEILGIKKEHIKDGYIHLSKTKNGTARNVPLTKKAKEMLTWLQHDDDRLIPLTESAFINSQKRVLKKANIDNLKFHDTRHEAISRLAKIPSLDVQDLAKITGHKDIKTLVNVYYNPTINELMSVLDN